MARDGLGAVLFDFDYTLADSSEGVVDCTGFALRELGHVPPARDAICRTIGLSLEHSFSVLTGSTSAHETAQFRALFIEHADRVMAERTVVYPGVAPVLDALAARDVAAGIVSTKFRYRIDDILERTGLRTCFDVIVGGEDVAEPKPHPEGLRAALERLRMPATRCLYVGDSRTDAETAARAEVPFVALLYGTTERHEFDDYAPCAILSDLLELPPLIESDPLRFPPRIVKVLPSRRTPIRGSQAGGLMPVPFPSLDFFAALQQRTKDDAARFEKLGYCDTTFGVQIGERLYSVGFEVYECTDVREGGDPAQLDFVLIGPEEVWREMVEAIVEHDGADAEHTLNTLSHVGDVIRVEYTDAEGGDRFYRYMASIQEFFDQARHLDVDLGGDSA